jgi:hypothetical protein
VLLGLTVKGNNAHMFRNREKYADHKEDEGTAISTVMRAIPSKIIA